MKEYLQKLIAGQDLSEQDAQAAMTLIGSGEVTKMQIAAFLMGVQQKGLTVSELVGFRAAMLDLAIKIDLTEFDAMDVCGTGGDGKDTFNISTTAAFIVAGAGQKVAKHGNHGLSSSVGSSTVLEKLGVQFSADAGFIKNKLEQAGMCYMHAPLFHPAMRFVGPVRKAIGVKTVFNILGPLLNPARVQCQLTGVSDMKTYGLYTELFRQTDARFGVLHALDGYDEISLTGPFMLATKDFSKEINVMELGLNSCKSIDLSGGGGLEESAQIVIDILENKGSIAQTEAVIANAGVALSVAKNVSLTEGIEMAWESLKSGKAREVLKELVK
jgi:anthranilate phosphoribosyltransferase